MLRLCVSWSGAKGGMAGGFATAAAFPMALIAWASPSLCSWSGDGGAGLQSCAREVQAISRAIPAQVTGAQCVEDRCARPPVL